MYNNIIITTNITEKSYVFRFEKYNKMNATNVAKIYTVNKNGNLIFKLSCIFIHRIVNIVKTYVIIVNGHTHSGI